jgi:hypothetical protein
MTKPYDFTTEGVDKFRGDAFDEIMRLIEEATPETPVTITILVGDARLEIPAFPETFEAMEDFVVNCRQLMNEIEAEDESEGETS